MRASIYLSRLFFDRRHRLLSQYFYLCRLLFFFQINNNRRLNKLELALALGLALVASLILITTFLPRIIHAWSTKFSTFVWCELIEQRMFNNMKKNILWDSPVSHLFIFFCRLKNLTMNWAKGMGNALGLILHWTWQNFQVHHFLKFIQFKIYLFRHNFGSSILARLHPYRMEPKFFCW